MGLCTLVSRHRLQTRTHSYIDITIYNITTFTTNNETSRRKCREIPQPPRLDLNPHLYHMPRRLPRVQPFTSKTPSRYHEHPTFYHRTNLPFPSLHSNTPHNPQPQTTKHNSRKPSRLSIKGLTHLLAEFASCNSCGRGDMYTYARCGHGASSGGGLLQQCRAKAIATDIFRDDHNSWKVSVW